MWAEGDLQTYFQSLPESNIHHSRFCKNCWCWISCLDVVQRRSFPRRFWPSLRMTWMSQNTAKWLNWYPCLHQGICSIMSCASSHARSLKHPVARQRVSEVPGGVAWSPVPFLCFPLIFFTGGGFRFRIWNSMLFISWGIPCIPDSIQKTRGNEKHYSLNPPLSRLEVC